MNNEKNDDNMQSGDGPGDGKKRPRRNTLELEKLPDMTAVTRILPSTAYRMWTESVDIRNKESRKFEVKQKAFLIALIDYWLSMGVDVPFEQFDKQAIKQEGFVPNGHCKTALEVFDEMRLKEASDTVLLQRIAELSEDIFSSSRDNIPGDYPQNDSYLALYKAIWGEGVPPYLSRIMQRREALDLLDLIELWKPSLKLTKTKSDDARKQAEELIFAGIVNVFETIKEKLFNNGGEDLCMDELATNSITELQKIWQNQTGHTLKSWQIKHRAYIKLMLMYGIMKVVGTVNFVQKRQSKRTIQRIFEQHNPDGNNSTEVGLKEIVSVVMKDLKHFLSDTTEPDPRTIKDHIRVRWDVALPEGVLETNNINEIRAYVVNNIAQILSIIGTSYTFDRLRNSWVGKGINPNSGDRHRAFQFTVYPLNDIRYKDEETDEGNPNQLVMPEFNHELQRPGSDPNEIVLACPETFPFEVQLVAPMTPEERSEDNKKYEKKKINELKKLLGCEVQFKDHVNNLADLFIKQVKLPEEKAGGIAGLSEKERFAIDFLRILATNDAETVQYLKEAYTDKNVIVKSKFNRAIKNIAQYWDGKMHLFMQDKIEILQEIARYLQKSLRLHINFINDYLPPEEISKGFDTVQNMISELHEFEDDLKQLPPYDMLKIRNRIKKLAQSKALMGHDDEALKQRLSQVIDSMYEYYVVHYEQTDILKLSTEAEEGLFDLFR